MLAVRGCALGQCSGLKAASRDSFQEASETLLLSESSIFLFVHGTSKELQIYALGGVGTLMKTRVKWKKSRVSTELKEQRSTDAAKQQQATHSTYQWREKRQCEAVFVMSPSLPCHSVQVFVILACNWAKKGCRTHKSMAELRSARRYRVIHLRLAAKLEMQLTISAFCFSAPHMLRRKGGKGDRTRGSYKPLPQPQVSLAQLAQWLHKDLAPDEALARLDISTLQDMRFLPKRAQTQ